MGTGNVRQRVKQLVPPIARRDEKLAALAAEVRDLRKQVQQARSTPAPGAQDELAELRGSLERPSLQRSLDDLRRSVVPLRGIDHDQAHPLRQLPFKLRNYRLAASHGIAVPEIYAAWTTVDEIDLSGLPDEFVVKSDGGAGGHGVLPLRRDGEDRYTLVSTDRVMTSEDVRERLRGISTLSGPYFAEELLHGVDGGAAIPEDVKIFAFYGEIGQVLLRHMDEHANLRRASYRFVDEHGADLGDGVWDARLDRTIEPPSRLATMVDVAKHLSLAVGVPFVRVDLYETDRGVVLGELTRVPGGRPQYSAGHDAFMGELYENGRWRLERDIVKGRPPGILHGAHEAPNPYPPGHVSQQPDPGTWAVQRWVCPSCEAAAD